MTEEIEEKAGEEQNFVGVRLLTQYVKDISFENPKSPFIFQKMQKGAALEAAVNVEVNAVQPDLYEVILGLNTVSKVEGENAFLIELTYAGLFAISGLDEETLKQVLFIECPTIMFPFARRVISDLTRDGGFAPLLLEPIDFKNLYEMRLRGGNNASDNESYAA